MPSVGLSGNRRLLGGEGFDPPAEAQHCLEMANRATDAAEQGDYPSAGESKGVVRPDARTTDRPDRGPDVQR